MIEIIVTEGVRRDTTTNGEGRMEISEIIGNSEVSEIGLIFQNVRIFIVKNWMPILNAIPLH
jgi:hypothetical protein